MNNSLLKPFTSREIKAALFEMPPNKAPGYNGMNVGFFQRYWDIVRVDVYRAVISFFHSGRMLESLNRTQIILIPKVSVPTKVTKFRPIYLCTTSYKIIAKVIANCLKSFLPSIISKNQSAFVEGRQITDNILIAHEVTHYIRHKRRGKQGVAAFKLDMAKAYDRVEWSYLQFVLESEGLTTLVNDYASKNLLHGFRINKYCLLISHLLFADDFMISILESYEAASGQKVNKGKSSVLFSPNTPTEAKSRLSMKVDISLEARAANQIMRAMSYFRLPKSLMQQMSAEIAKFWWGSKNGPGGEKSIGLNGINSVNAKEMGVWAFEIWFLSTGH
ncbi:hypothetical protein RHSIM_Rhsim02G0169100 [Rhododendron simsii]|uniref:Reverse transcriptase domain-containing protein n=1 Tax=Rhododendron simsii TaxID=118357 RepID=A0A834LSF9_RHOSS|nr:hypothetical protein RHSIM_Rhsim02G0169100 [Rhododendron simsii]